MPIKQMAGLKFGRLTAMGIAPYKFGIEKAKWHCQCECGRGLIVCGAHLRNGSTLSCGCWRREVTTKKNFKHGLKKRGLHAPEYNSWAEMIKRCENKNRKSFPYYGGRGISVCKRWRESFSNFLSDVGHKPSVRHSIDRIDNDGNYEPCNCRWATRIQQEANKRPRGSCKTSQIGLKS